MAAAVPATHSELSEVQHKASSALQKTKQNLAFLVDPKKAPAPATYKARALLRSARYIGIFLFWRLVRYAKYAAIGALSAAVAGTAIGSIASGAAFVIAPTGIFAGAGVGLIWAVAKFGWKVMGRRVWSGESHSANPRLDEQAEHERAEEVKPPSADPW